MLDNERFQSACERVLNGEGSGYGIGALSERTLHRILKYYYEPCDDLHEVSFMGYVADVKNKKGIIEIQTANPVRLLPKLKAFLSLERTTVVLPLFSKKYINTLDKNTGEVVSRRKSPNCDTVYSAFYDLYPLRDLLDNENLTVKLLFLTADVYKTKKTKRYEKTKIDTLPRDLVSEIDITSTQDVARLLPTDLPEEFTRRELSKALRLPYRRISYTVGFLQKIGVINLVGKRGREMLYKINPIT